jgi:hypothetical protein
MDPDFAAYISSILRYVNQEVFCEAAYYQVSHALSSSHTQEPIKL